MSAENVEYLYLVLTQGGPPNIDWDSVSLSLSLKKPATMKRWSRLKKAMADKTAVSPDTYRFLWLCVKHSTREEKHDWNEIAEKCGTTAGAASKRYSRMKLAFENGTATMPDAPTPKGKGDATGTPKKAKATPKKDTKAKATSNDDDGTPSPEPKPRAPAKRKRPTPKAKSETPAAEKNDTGADAGPDAQETAIAKTEEQNGDDEKEEDKPKPKRMRVTKKPESKSKTPAAKTRTPTPAPDMNEEMIHILSKTGSVHPNLLAELEAAVGDAQAHQTGLAVKEGGNGDETETETKMEGDEQVEEQVQTEVDAGEENNVEEESEIVV